MEGYHMKLTKSQSLIAGLIIVFIGAALCYFMPQLNMSGQSGTLEECNTSGKREKSVKKDIGYGPREYYAYTNEYAQLVKVEAREITLQKNEELKPENKGRYCADEAKVPGVEKSNLDEGHVIADSLGGNSTAYNITPQESSVNRKDGAQFNMEVELQQALRQKKAVTDFEATITYPDTKTQIPNHYHYEVKIAGTKKVYDFDNK